MSRLAPCPNCQTSMLIDDTQPSKCYSCGHVVSDTPPAPSPAEQLDQMEAEHDQHEPDAEHGGGGGISMKAVQIIVGVVIAVAVIAVKIGVKSGFKSWFSGSNASAAGSDESAWNVVHGKDNGWHAEFPAKHTYKSRTLRPVPGVTLTLHQYEAFPSWGDEFAVGYFDVPMGIPFDIKGGLDGAIEVAKKDLKKVTVHSRTYVGLRGAKEIRGYTSGGRIAQAVAVCVDRRFYIVGAMGQDEETRRRFLESFTLDKEPTSMISRASRVPSPAAPVSAPATGNTESPAASEVNVPMDALVSREDLVAEDGASSSPTSEAAGATAEGLAVNSTPTNPAASGSPNTSDGADANSGNGEKNAAGGDGDGLSLLSDAWTTFVSADGRYSIEIPQKPEPQTLWAGKRLSNAFMSKPAGRTRFLVLHMPLPPQAADASDRLMSATIDFLVGSFNTEPKVTPAVVAGSPGKRFVCQGVEGLVVVVEDRLVAAMSVDAPAMVADRFLLSLKVQTFAEYLSASEVNLTAALTGNNPTATVKALRHLAETGTNLAAAGQTSLLATARQQVVTLLKSEVADLRLEAARTLKVLGDDSCVIPLAAAVSDESRPVATAALESLAGIGTPTALMALSQQLEVPTQRLAARRILEGLGSPAEPYVLAMVTVSDKLARSTVCELLGTIGGSNSEIVLRRLATKDPEGIVRLAAERAYARILERQAEAAKQ